MTDKAMSIKEAAAYLGIEEGTLRNWRNRRIGPPSFALSSRKIIYRQKELDRWLEARRQTFEDKAHSA